MDYRQLGKSGLRVSTLALGTMTFGGRGKFAKTGAIDARRAARLLDLCLDAGVNLVDTADVYSGGLAEEISARRCVAGATGCWSPPRRGFARATARTTPACRAST